MNSVASIDRVRTAEADRAVAIWLLGVAAATVLTLLVGGITRLTLSGLSITEWNPVMGTLPPLGQEAWADAFDRYRQIPEYRHVHYGMTLDQFKILYFWEYLHRLLARAVGLLALGGLVALRLAGRIGTARMLRLLIVPVLVLCQGALGWYMVASGLQTRDSVSQYRLAAHLALALVLYACCVWWAASLLAPVARHLDRRWRRRLAGLAAAVLGLVAVTIVAGAFTAGTKAGLVYNSFPLMGGQWIPADYGALSPWWLNPVENVAAIQFDHRLLAESTGFAGFVLAGLVLARAVDPALRWRAWLLVAAVALQLGLGIATLVTVVPVPLAAAHQAGAVLVLTASLLLSNALTRAAR